MVDSKIGSACDARAAARSTTDLGCVQPFFLFNSDLLDSLLEAFSGPFALTGHMVQNPPYWMAKECSRFGHKGIPTCQA